MFAAAAGIQLEIASGQFDFSLHGAVASRVIVDHNQKTWTCSEGVQSPRLYLSSAIDAFTSPCAP